MSINQVRVENSIPCLIEKECRVMERKDINAIFEIENEKYSEVGTLFLTSKRLIFCSEESKSLHSFEAEINKVRDCTYFKKSNNRILEGFVSVDSHRKLECKFAFRYHDTGFRSLVSVFFSIYEQIQTKNVYCSTPGLKQNSREYQKDYSHHK